MRKAAIILLIVVGSHSWATEGKWTYSEDGSFYIEYSDSVVMWEAFRRYTEGSFMIGESQIPIRFARSEHRLEVRMFTHYTIFELYDDGHYSWFVLLKQ